MKRSVKRQNMGTMKQRSKKSEKKKLIKEIKYERKGGRRYRRRERGNKEKENVEER